MPDDWHNSSRGDNGGLTQLEHRGGSFDVQSSAAPTSLGDAYASQSDGSALGALLKHSATVPSVSTILALSDRVLGQDSFAYGVVDVFTSGHQPSLVDGNRLLWELVLADVYDRRWELLPSNASTLESTPGTNSCEQSLFEDRLRHASDFRDALVAAVCEAIQYSKGSIADVKRSHKKRWLEYHRHSSSTEANAQGHAGTEFGHLLAATLSQIDGPPDAVAKLHRMAIRSPKLQQALAMLQWDAGQSISPQELPPPPPQRQPAAESIEEAPRETHWVDLQHEIVFPDDQGQCEPAADVPYRITFADGQEEFGTLDANGCAHHAGIAPGKVTVEYEPDIDDEIRALQSEIKTALDEALAAERAESAAMDAALDGEGVVGKGLIYTGAAMIGAKKAVVGLFSFLGDAAVAVGKGAVATAVKAGRYLNPLTMPKEFDRDVAAAKEAYEALREFADEDLETYFALAADKDTWAILWDFASGYVEAQHSTEWAEAGGEAIPAVILLLVTGGAGAAAGAGGAAAGTGSRIAQLSAKVGPKLKKLVQLLKRRRAKKRGSGSSRQRMKTSRQIDAEAAAPFGGAVPKGARFGPLKPGPLGDDIARTFRSGTYTQQSLARETKLYRVISDDGNPTGSFWTRKKPLGPQQSIIDLALDPNWGNTATRVVTARVPAGTTIYEGAAAAQRGLVGGGNQIYIPKVDPRWIQ